MRISLFCIFIILPQLAAAQVKTAWTLPIVTGANVAVTSTEYGKVRGYIHRGTYTFKGIPYAKAMRFMPPQKPDAWTGVRSSMAYGPLCPILTPPSTVPDENEFVYHHDWGYSNENCLNLNIWSPAINDGKKRPVMVWLHGGGYTFGSSHELPSLEGENLSKKGDVIVVSVNHRLNVIGFLDLSEFGDKYKSSPNVGMMDLVSALQWVKTNISNFGGDPDNITIFGQSGGGGKVATLMATPSAKGLFQKAIVQSGATTRFIEPALSKRVGLAVLNELGIIPSAIDSIQKVPYEKLAAAAARAVEKVRSQLIAEGKPMRQIGFGWGPVHDGTFLPYTAYSQESLALSSSVPLMIGSTKYEFMPSLRPELRDASTDVVMAFFQKTHGSNSAAYEAAIKKSYPNDKKISDLIDIDTVFRTGALNHSNKKSGTGGAAVYQYLFTWQSPVMDGEYKGIHCMELPFAFNNVDRCEEMTGGGKDAYALADKMSQAWVNFAGTGNPNHKGLPIWQPYTMSNGAVMLFDNQCTLAFHPDEEIQKLYGK